MMHLYRILESEYITGLGNKGNSNAIFLSRLGKIRSNLCLPEKIVSSDVIYSGKLRISKL